jgi:hypothetical protein
MHKSILYTALLLSACAVYDEETLDDTVQEVTSANGISLNGISLNGISLNGISLNGISLNGISLNGTSSSGTSISGVSSSGAPLSTASVAGSTWNATASNGTMVKLRIDSAVVGTGTSADLWFYKVSYQTSSGWSPLCGLDGAGLPVQAISVAGVWITAGSDTASYTSSSTQFTFACRGKTIAKCVELGYKTFKGRTNQMTSCVRLLRGDYCGTGAAYTVDGTSVNLYDNIGVQTDTQSWTLEAEWTPTGARCVNSNNLARYNLALARDPKCVKPIKTSTCGSTFANGAVLIDELQ